MSSEDPTLQLNAGADTKPTLEAVIHRIDRLGALVLEQFRVLNIRLDRMESEIKQTHSELYALRADFAEFKGHFKEVA